MVLLRNENGTLPFSSAAQGKVAVIGPNADNEVVRVPTPGGPF
jgi:beta-glucosidase-like glycosyl hydrolase